MARKQYKSPVFNILEDMGGSEGGGTIPIPGSQEAPTGSQTAGYSAWKMAVQNANLDIDQSYAGYVDWMVKNGYAAYIQPDDSELQ